MNWLKQLALIVTFLIFAGCAKNLQMGYYSVLDKDYRFNINAPVLIMHDVNDLLSAYYTDLVIYVVHADLSGWYLVILYHLVYIPLCFSISQFYGPNHRFHYHR